MPCARSRVSDFCRRDREYGHTTMRRCRLATVKRSRNTYIVAYMTEALALDGGEKVLEIGTGSGYAAAVLAKIAADVYTIERIDGLAIYGAHASRRPGLPKRACPAG